MQCILLDAHRKIFFQNDPCEQKVRSYTCPICGEKGFQEAELATHVFAEHPAGHKSANVEVICPLCAVPTENSSNPRTLFLAQHLALSHRLKKPTKSSHLGDDRKETAIESSSATIQNPSRALRRRDLRKHTSHVSRGVIRPDASSAASIKLSNSAWQEEELAHLFSLKSSTLRQLAVHRNEAVTLDKVLNAPHSPSNRQTSPSFTSDKCVTASLAKSDLVTSKRSEDHLPNSQPSHNSQLPQPTATLPNPTIGVSRSLAPFVVDKKQTNGSPETNCDIKSTPQLALIENIQLSGAENRLLADFGEKPSPTKTDSFGDLTTNHSDGVLNLVSLVLNSNSVDISTIPDANTESLGDKEAVPQPSSPNYSHLPTPSASTSKPSKKAYDDRPSSQKDNFGLEFSSFLHELIFDSLHLTGLREALNKNEDQPG